MKNKILAAFIATTILLVGTVWVFGMIKHEREACVHNWKDGVSFEDYEKECRDKYISPASFQTCIRCGEVATTETWRTVPMPPIPENDHNITEELFQPVNGTNCDVTWPTTNPNDGDILRFNTTVTEPNLIFVADPNEWTINTDIAEIELSIKAAPDLQFWGVGGPSVTFVWGNGRFDVVFDPNRFTESAKVFCEAMEPYLNEYIVEKAKELVVTK